MPGVKINKSKDRHFPQRLQFALTRMAEQPPPTRAGLVAELAQQFGCGTNYARAVFNSAAAELAANKLSDAQESGEIVRNIAAQFEVTLRTAWKYLRQARQVLVKRTHMQPEEAMAWIAALFLKQISDPRNPGAVKVQAIGGLARLYGLNRGKNEGATLNIINNSQSVVQQLIAHVESGTTTEVVDGAYINARVSQALIEHGAMEQMNGHAKTNGFHIEALDGNRDDDDSHRFAKIDAPPRYNGLQYYPAEVKHQPTKTDVFGAKQ